MIIPLTLISCIRNLLLFHKKKGKSWSKEEKSDGKIKSKLANN